MEAGDDPFSEECVFAWNRMIHQHFRLVDVLTAAENIVLGLDGGLTVNRKEINRKVEELAKRYPDLIWIRRRKSTIWQCRKSRAVEILKVLLPWSGYFDPGRADRGSDAAGDRETFCRAP